MKKMFEVIKSGFTPEQLPSSEKIQFYLNEFLEEVVNPALGLKLTAPEVKFFVGGETAPIAGSFYGNSGFIASGKPNRLENNIIGIDLGHERYTARKYNLKLFLVIFRIVAHEFGHFLQDKGQLGYSRDSKKFGFDFYKSELGKKLALNVSSFEEDQCDYLSGILFRWLREKEVIHFSTNELNKLRATISGGIISNLFERSSEGHARGRRRLELFDSGFNYKNPQEEIKLLYKY